MPEKEYIEREVFLEAVRLRYCKDCKYSYNGAYCRACWVDDMIDEIEDAPTADVVEVRHGVWNLYFDGKELMCSVCKATFWDECGNGGTNYCPNCGAKMDGKENVKC